jgi:isoquinoline 1-oxidoreductase subunit beta
MAEMPKVEVMIVASREKPTGVGEPGVPPIGPAVANAWRALTGTSVRQLPFAAGQEAA